MPSFTFDDAAEIVSPQLRPYFDAELKAEQVWLARNHPSGVRWSGMSHEPYAPRTVAQMLDAARDKLAKDEAFKATPRGRFLACLQALRAQAAPEAETLAALWSRALADERAPLDTDALLRAIRILNGIDAGVGRDGVQALCDLAAPIAAAA